MTRLLFAAIVAALAVAPAAAQDVDFLTAKIIACAPERMTRCKEPGVECETRDASERDKSQPLVVDFVAKKSFIRRENNNRPFGDVTEDKVEGETRRVVLLPPGAPAKDALTFVLTKAGKMNGEREGGRIKMETVCKRES